jgi:chitinase
VASCIDLFIKGNLPMIGGEPQGGPGAGFGVFDGIDLDWEWPASEGNAGNVIRAEDKANFVALLAEFRSQLNAYGATVGKTYDLTAFLPADIAKIDAGIRRGRLQQPHLRDSPGVRLLRRWQPQTNHQSQVRNPAANPAPADQRFSVDSAVQKYLSIGAPPASSWWACRIWRGGPVCPTSTTASTRTAARPQAHLRPAPRTTTC